MTQTNSYRYDMTIIVLGAKVIRYVAGISLTFPEMYSTLFLATLRESRHTLPIHLS